LLTFLLSPVCNWLQRRGLGRIAAVVLTTTVGFTLLGIAIWAAAVQMNGLTPKIPEYRRNLEAKFHSVNEYAVSALRKATRTAQETGKNLTPAGPIGDPRGTDELPFSVRVLPPSTSAWQAFGGMFGTLFEVLGTAGIVVVLVMFFLFRREDLRDRFIHLVGKGHVTVTTQMLEDAGARVSRYLSTLFLLNLMFGASIGVGLYLIGVPNSILWGIFSATLRFIPYLGPWLAAVMPIALSMAVSTGWMATILTVLLFVLLELFNNNLLEPWLYGKNTGVSPVAVILAAVFWAWLWGPMGLLLATPLTVCVLVVGKHIPQLAFLDTLLGTEPVFEPKLRVYQRLLAGDQQEAVDLFEEHLKLRPAVEVYDMMLIPALAIAELHWQLGELTDAKRKFILQSLKEMIYDKEVAPLARTDELFVDPSRLSVLCLPAHSEADEITGLMLAKVLAPSGCQVEIASISAQVDEMIELVERRKPLVVCISATPPAAVLHARHLCRRIHDRFPEVHLIVGLWDAPGDLVKASERISFGAVVVSSLADAQGKVNSLIQPHIKALPKSEAAA
jgi:predicted PurR-regulated permease PerM